MSQILVDKDCYEALVKERDNLKLELDRLRALGPYKSVREIAALKVANKIKKVTTVCNE